MNKRAIFLAILVWTGLTIIAAFPMMIAIFTLLMVWRGYVLLNPDKMNHETAIVLRKATQAATVLTIGFVVLLLVLMSQSPIPTYIEVVDMSYSQLSPEQLTFNPAYALMYIVTGRKSLTYYGSIPQTQTPPPMIQPEATVEPLG
ncbi:MAG: hypothetical protein MUF38_10130 [Anaerolineae bacterium]|jgi:hypothetical protein|nr:hypothetical protein [Anaerolineae bacterium]